MPKSYRRDPDVTLCLLSALAVGAWVYFVWTVVTSSP